MARQAKASAACAPATFCFSHPPRRPPRHAGWAAPWQQQGLHGQGLCHAVSAGGAWCAQHGCPACLFFTCCLHHSWDDRARLALLAHSCHPFAHYRPHRNPPAHPCPNAITAAGGLSSEEAEELQQENAGLRDALEGARQELQEAYKQACVGGWVGGVRCDVVCGWRCIAA